VDELDARALLRVRIVGVVAALVAALAVLLAGPVARQLLTDLFQRVAPAPKTAQPPVAVVLIDGPSLAAVGGWPWPRYVMARLTDAIAAQRPKAIGLDLLFPEPDRLTPRLFADLYPELPSAAAAQVRALPSMDDVFAQVIGRSPVVLARGGVPRESLDARGAATPLPPEARFAGRAPSSLPAYPEALSDLPVIDSAAHGHGLINAPRDPDGVMRRVPLVSRVAGALTPAFPLELVRVAEAVGPLELLGDAERLRAVKVGSHVVPVDRQGAMTPRFRELPRSTVVSAVDLLHERFPPNAFAGKIVVVGMGAAGTADVVTTPRESATFGSLVEAQAVEAILGADVLSTPDWAAPAAWGIGAALVVAGLLLIPRASLTATGAAAGGAIAAALGASWLGFQRGLLLDPWPAIGPGAAAATASVGMLFAEGRRVQARLKAAAFALEAQRAFYSATLARYLAPQVIDRLVGNQDEVKIGADEREITVIVSDLENFSGLVDRLSLETFSTVINGYFEGLIEIFWEHEAVIDKMTGDGLIALFGAPIAIADHAARAVACVRDIDVFAQAYRQRMIEAYGVSFGRTRMGLGTGLGLVGNFGGKRRFNYTAYGPAVVVAARLEAANKTFGTRILLSEETRRQAGDLSDARSVGRIRLKGLAEPVEAFTLGAEA
jgi:class 3 adenylate cyclase/CHASE2 domain-containing sensor protein